MIRTLNRCTGDTAAIGSRHERRRVQVVAQVSQCPACELTWAEDMGRVKTHVGASVAYADLMPQNPTDHCQLCQAAPSEAKLELSELTAVSPLDG